MHVIEEGQDAGKFKQIMTQKTVHFLAFFILVYVGVEVTIGGENLVESTANQILMGLHRMDRNVHYRGA